MDPERQHLLRPGQDGEEIKIIYGPDSIAFPASLHGKVPPDRFYHTMQRLNETYGPMSRWTKFFIIALILLFVGILMPFAMLRWFTPRHFEVKMWIPIDGILIAVNVGLGLLLYIRSRRIRSELAKIVKKENKVCYHRTGVHLRFEPGGMATRPSIVIEHTATTASDHAAYGSYQERQAPPSVHRGRAPPQSSRMPSTRLPSPPPFRQQHSFYELQQQNASPMPQQQPRAQSPPPPQQQQQQQPEFRSPPISPRGYPPQRQQPPPASAEFQSGGPMSPRGYQQQHQQPNQRQPSPPMSPRYQQQQQYAGGPPPPSGNYAPQASAPPPSSYRPQPPSPGGGSFEGSPLTGHLATEFTSVPVRDSPSQRQHYDPTEGHYSPSPSPTPKKRSLAPAAGSAQNPPYSPARQQQPPQQQQHYQQQHQQQFYSPHQGDPRQAASPRSSAPYGQARAF